MTIHRCPDCNGCGQPFTPSTPTALYCSTRCRDRAANHRARCPEGDACTKPHRWEGRVKAAPDLARMMRKIDTSGGPDSCWEWQGYCTPLGYGMTYWTVSGKKKTVHAHRAFYSLTKDVTLPTEVMLLHSCDNPPCCNPAHLSEGDHLQNMADRKNRGAGYPSGADHYKAIKVADEVVAAIRAEYKRRTPGRGTPALAAKYGISRSIVDRIIKREGRWAA